MVKSLHGVPCKLPCNTARNAMLAGILCSKACLHLDAIYAKQFFAHLFPSRYEQFETFNEECCRVMFTSPRGCALGLCPVPCKGCVLLTLI